MKKKNLLKVIGVYFLIVVVLTWIIPAGSYQAGKFVKDATSPVGILDFFRIPLTTLTNYANYGILILLIGGLYGVMNRTGAYSKLVSHFTKKYAKKEKTFAIISILFFSILSSVSGLSFVLLIFVPLFMAILLRLGYKKLPTLMATIGAILAGNAASTYGFNIVGYLNYYFELDINSYILLKVIFFAVVVALLIFFVTKNEKLEKKNQIDIPLLDDDHYAHKSTKSYAPMLIVLAFVLVLLGVACYNWTYAINYKGFEELYEKMVALKINGYPLLKNIIGNFSPFGYWNVTEMNIVLLIATALIAWLYSVKFEDYIDALKDGAKQVLPVAFYVMLASVITSVILGSSTGTSIYFTMVNWILPHAGKVANVIVMFPISVISGAFINEFPYFVNYMATNLTTAFTHDTAYPLLAFVMQSAHGMMMFLLPTSALLIAGLSYLKVSFIDWIKYAWKYVLGMGIASVIAYIILSIMI